MLSKLFMTLFYIFPSLIFHLQKQSWVRAGYWLSGRDISEINSTLFTHLICGRADINTSNYEIKISSDDEHCFSGFMTTVKQKNPSITTFPSIGGGNQDNMDLSLMANSSVGRKSFIDSSIKMARSYSFQGLDLSWVFPNTSSDMNNMALLLEEWRVVAEFEAKNNVSYPVDSMQKNLNWINIMAHNYNDPSWENITGPRAALHDPASHINTADGIRAWIYRGLSANKLVLGLPFFGSGWTLQNSQNNGIGAPVTGPATGRLFTERGNIPYKFIKQIFIQRYRDAVKYNAIYVMNYCFNGSTWICFDGVEAVEIKVFYTKEMGLLVYYVLEVTHDDNWEVSLSTGRN